MAAIVPPYGYPTATDFDPDGHNRNVYSATPGEGIMSESNGRLSAGAGGNMAVGFAVIAEHIQPESLIQTDVHTSRRPLEFYSDMSPDEAGTERTFVQIGDCACRFDLDIESSVVLLQWQFFVHQWRHHFQQTVPGPTVNGSPAIIIKALLDGVSLEYTRRPVANTARIIDGGALALEYLNRESLAAQWWCMAAMSDTLSAGVHELSVRLYMEPTTGTELLLARTIRGEAIEGTH